ncbi:biotin-dependent carboxyltransferase family protein [Gemmobacter fulvus]|uniref:5-oxoprolinase subunit C family protein n=1 Tax=Gemmobacter fulvus TaxID=2840474 RepID=UPI00279671E0|nr:biotin-dependent carboxyltransferase family protein [Gemmobacter fulvus]MDQ1850606.1 biotin-dependent carboxyltransferase family protein [Gemmobacter fulvus]
MIHVLKQGLETSIQDWPGRQGFWNKGFPPSGPVDSWSFRMANLLVGNAAGDAGLEAQFMGPTLRFDRDAVIALAGADMKATLDAKQVPMWQSIPVRAGQVLAMGAARTGARGYLAVAGGLANDQKLGSRATFHKAGVGGMNGHALKAGQDVPVGDAQGTVGMKVPETARPAFSTDRSWQIEVCAGPNDDWIDAAGHDRFLTSDWKLSPKSDRTGYRLEGPEWTFAPKATDKPPEHGSLPANIIDHGYPMGAINLAGQTPIILMNDGPSMGGFINPYTVPSVAFWKLAQAKPGEILRFKLIEIETAQRMAAELTALCTPATLVSA